MKPLNTKLVLSALGIVAMLTSPAFAQKPHRQLSHQQTYSNRQSGVGIYDMVPNSYDPAVTGGGSVGYNQNLHDDAW
jgi:hypothetical protein